MIRCTFPAMGSGIEAWCPDQEALVSLRSWFEDVEAVCSRFRPDSEVSRINESKDTQFVVSGLLAEVLEAAERARLLTGGLVDAGVGSGVSNWGYDRSFDQVADIGHAPPWSPAPEWSIDARHLARATHTRIDLGGVAKGWTCDRSVERGMASVVSAGGDLRSADPETTVSVMDPWGEVGARVTVGIGALATSSVTRRRWMAGDREVSHIIDPRTMEPVRTPVLSATVVARSAVDAETGAKAVLIHGEDGLEWASEQDWIDGALVMWHDGRAYATPGMRVAA